MRTTSFTRRIRGPVTQFVVLICLLGLLVPSGLRGAEDAKSDNTIRIAVAGAQSGKLSGLGIPTLRAAQIAAEKINEKGGIFDKKVRIIPQDDQCQAEKAAAIANDLISEGISLVLGHTCSGPTKAALDVYRNSDVIVISSSATNPALTQRGDYPNFFRTISPDDAQVKIQTDFLLGVSRLSKIAILHDNDDYGRGQAEFARMFVKQSGKAEVVLYEEIAAGSYNYSEIVQKIRKSGAQGVIYGGYYPEASQIVAQMQETNMKIVFIAGDGVKDDSFIKFGQKYAGDVYVTAPRDTSDNSMAMDAIDSHKKKYREPPGQFYLNGYAGTLAFFNAIRKSGSLDHTSIVRFLRRSYVRTPIGSISFDRKGDVRGYGFSLFKIENGKYAEVELK